jgi:hypothetical protein
MKTILNISLIALFLLAMACNNRVQVTPKDVIAMDSTINANFKAYSDNDYYRINAKGIYVANIELYLRAFQALNPKTPVALTFHSDNFAVLIVKKDTLYPDDQTTLLYSDFINFRQNATFYSTSQGNQKVNFDLLISNTAKKATATFENR